MCGCGWAMEVRVGTAPILYDHHPAHLGSLVAVQQEHPERPVEELGEPKELGIRVRLLQGAGSQLARRGNGTASHGSGGRSEFAAATTVTMVTTVIMAAMGRSGAHRVGLFERLDDILD